MGFPSHPRGWFSIVVYLWYEIVTQLLRAVFTISSCGNATLIFLCKGPIRPETVTLLAGVTASGHLRNYRWK